MQIVIDIPENIYEAIKDSKSIFLNGQRNGKTLLSILVSGVWNGIPLPKGYGRLIDANALVRKAYKEAQGMTNNNFGVEVEWLVDKSPTIIEADKENT